MATEIDDVTRRIAGGEALSAERTDLLFTALMAGQFAPDAVERFLRALAARGETIAEIVGAARVLRRHVTAVSCTDPGAIDTCGTGGDGISTFNVSTAAAFVAAGAGATVAKHGNRTHSRCSGSADVLEALGVPTDLSPTRLGECLREIGIAFLHAARLHPAMAVVAPVRRAIGTPTIFNYLGPLTNPAAVTRQIIGVPRAELLPLIAEALRRLGAVHAWVVHGDDGLCDLTTTTTSRYIELRDGRLTEHALAPEEAGLPRSKPSELLVDSPAASADMIRAVLSGQPGPARHHTLLNAGAALVVAGRAGTLKVGIKLAADSIDTGRAAAKLEALVQFR
ncbi:Anthranilate phosphoribosyltransferase [Phycisphaerae bacterium RAS2]|nr:Anthranilate phosphoribosyltransferase [Phycisphaerae bacterium RAS2]